MISSWFIIKYLYLGSMFFMAWYIIKNQDQFLIGYGMQERDDEKGERLSFAATMMVYIILAPIFILILFNEKNKRK